MTHLFSILALLAGLGTTLQAVETVSREAPTEDIQTLDALALATTPEAEAVELPLPDQRELAPESYPLDRCPVTGNALGSMGEPPAIDVQGMTVLLCCAHCGEEAHQRADTIRGALTKALVKRDGDSYPLTACVACGAPLPKKPLNLVHGSTLIRVDGEACAAGLSEHGAVWSEDVRAARAAQAGTHD